LLLISCAAPITTIRDPRIQDAAGDTQLLEVPFYRQKSLTGCGASAMAGVLTYWGQAVAPRFILNRFPPTAPTQGYTLGELKQIARHYQLQAFAFQADLNALETHLAAGRPLIVPLQIDSELPLMPAYDHYVIVVGLDRMRGRVYLVDPQVGVIILTLTDFNRKWRAKSRALLLAAP
jgi:ABC-type bacteriocin/lantibiotic exporter with double-glycine peptidase domain